VPRLHPRADGLRACGAGLQGDNRSGIGGSLDGFDRFEDMGCELGAGGCGAPSRAPTRFSKKGHGHECSSRCRHPGCRPGNPGHPPANLATLYDRFRVVHIMDVNEAVATAVAARTGARSTTNAHVLLDDPAVDVVADLHSAPVPRGPSRRTCQRRETRRSLRETSRYERRRSPTVADVSASSGMPVLVGAVHAYDPAVVAAQHSWGEPPDQDHTRTRHRLPA
jgi:hypothetical protein